jgi:hypothetical protein
VLTVANGQIQPFLSTEIRDDPIMPDVSIEPVSTSVVTLYDLELRPYGLQGVGIRCKNHLYDPGNAIAV